MISEKDSLTPPSKRPNGRIRLVSIWLINYIIRNLINFYKYESMRAYYVYMCEFVIICLCVGRCVCLYVLMYVCIHVYMHLCMYVLIYACMYACMHVSMHVCMYVHMYLRTYACWNDYVYVCECPHNLYTCNELILCNSAYYVRCTVWKIFRKGCMSDYLVWYVRSVRII